MKWYLHVSSHDTHDFDDPTTPILFGKIVDGKRRKLLWQATRSGFLVTLNRESGKYVVGKPFVPLDYYSGLSPKGEPIPILDKDPSVARHAEVGASTQIAAFSEDIEDQRLSIGFCKRLRRKARF